MAGIHKKRSDTVPTGKDALLAKETIRLFASLPKSKQGLRVKVQHKKMETEITLPQAVVNLLVDALAQIARGNSVSLIPTNAELTTQQAADLLNVSRPYLIKVLEERKIPSRKIGKHRRVLVEDLMRYKAISDARREKALSELAKQAQELDMGY